MKTKHLLLPLFIVAFSSCSTAYKTGQTPDDVYYSPPPPAAIDYVTSDNQQDKDKYAYNNTSDYEDIAIRRGISNPRYRSNISLDFGYGYYPYDYYSSPFYSPYYSYYNPYAYSGVIFSPYNYNYYNSHYSPYYNYYYPPTYYISKPGEGVSNYRGPRQFNLGVYNNNNINTNRVYNHTQQPAITNSSPTRTFQTQQRSGGRGVGNFIRRVLTPSNNSRSYSDDNSSTNSSPGRTIQTNTSGGSSSSSGSSGSAPVRTFRR